MRWLVKIIEAIWPGSVEGLDPANTRLRAMRSLLDEQCRDLQQDNDSLRRENLRLSRELGHIGRMTQVSEDVRTGRRYVPGAFVETFTVPSIGRSYISESAILESRALRRAGPHGNRRPRTFTGPEPEDL